MGAPLILYFPGKEPPHKEFLGWDPNWGIWGVFLYVSVLFSLLKIALVSRAYSCTGGLGVLWFA